MKMGYPAVLASSLLIAALGACSPNSSPAGTALSVTNIEVTQGVQTSTNTVQLVAQRSTAVRVTLATAVSVGVPGVIGLLRVFVNGVEITTAPGLSSNNLTAPPAPQRGNEAHTLNFELPAPSGIPASSDVDFTVEVFAPGNVPKATGAVNNLSFVARTAPALFFTRVDYTPAAVGGQPNLPDLALIKSGVGDMFVRGMFPINDGDANLYREGQFPPLVFAGDTNASSTIDGFEGFALMSQLGSQRTLIVNSGLGATGNTFLYGWLAGNPIAGNGMALTPGFTAFGNTQLNKYQRTFAHELGHNLGFAHTTTTLSPDYGWDVGGRLYGNPSKNDVITGTGRAKANSLFDIMVGGQATPNAWVTAATYNSLLSNPILQDTRQAPRVTANDPASFPTRVLVVQGVVNPQGTALTNLEPAFRFPYGSQPSSSNAAGLYTLRVTDTAGVVTSVRFAARTAGDAESDELNGFFEASVAVAVDREVASLSITDLTGTVLGGFQASVAPTLSLTAPPAQLGAQTTVAWTLSDADTSRGKLQLQVAYSPDNGANWVPVAVDVAGTQNSVTFDSRQIKKSAGTGVIRVFVSDGVNTVYQQVAGLSATQGVY